MSEQSMYDELLELLTTDAASGKEAAVADKLVARLEAMGLTVTRDRAGEPYGGECGNVIAVLEGSSPGAVLLSSHMDRVPNGFGIRPVEKDGVLYSDGTTILAADDISGVCAILDGLRRVIASGKKHPRIEVVFSIGEEAGLWGFRHFDFDSLQARIGYIFDSPGSVGRFINGAPGMYKMHVELFGKSAHAGNEPEKGVDAAKCMCEILATLRTGRLDEESTANFPILSTGSTASNVVCDYAAFSGEARSRDLKKLNDYVAYFKETCETVADKYGAELKLQLDDSFLPFLLGEDTDVVKIARSACGKLGLPCTVNVGGGGMDANILNVAGFRTIGVATGYTNNHTPKEQLVLKDYFRSGELCAALIDECAAFFGD